MLPNAATRTVTSSRGGPLRAVISLPLLNPESISQTTGQPVQQPPLQPVSQPSQGPYLVTSPPSAGYIEYPAAGNIPPSTDPYAYIDPTTGQVLSPLPGASVVSTITTWVQANPILALALAAGAVWLLMDFLNGGGGGGRLHRRR